MAELSLAQRREKVVVHMMAAVRMHLQKEGVTRGALTEVGRELEKLVENHMELFPLSSFPTPQAEDRGGVRYLVYTDPESTISLYLNAIDPGKSAPPHNHMTWAAIAAIEGEELNRIYRRIDDGSDENRGDLVMEREFNVRRGSGIQFLPEDIHSIHIQGNVGTRHFHLYGQSLESLSDRLGFNLQTGAINRFNEKHLPAAKRALDLAS